MRMPANGLALLVSAVVATPLGPVSEHQSDPVQAIVDTFYPERLTPDVPSAKQSCYAVHAVTSQGEPSRIIAGYSDGYLGALRVLDQNAGSYQLGFDSPSEPALRGSSCRITLVDINSDGTQDVFLEFHSGQGSEAWLYRWQGTAPNNVTPTHVRANRMWSSLASALLLDTRHDGTLQVLSRGDSQPDEGETRISDASTLYKLGTNAYELNRPVLFARQFLTSLAPVLNKSLFYLVQGSNGPYRMRVINGNRLGQNRTTGGTITLNGSILVAPTQLHEQIEFLELALPTSLPDESVVQVQLQGSSAEIVIVIEDTTQIPPGGAP
jgi:hypothetical protein